MTDSTPAQQGPTASAASTGGFAAMSAMIGSGMLRRRSSATSRASATWSSL
jgi:hypothetical protein